MSSSSNSIVTRVILMYVLDSKLCHIAFTNIDVQIKRVTAQGQHTLATMEQATIVVA